MPIDGINLDVIQHTVRLSSQTTTIRGYIRWSTADTEHYLGNMRYNLPFFDHIDLNDCHSCSQNPHPILPYDDFADLDLELNPLKHSPKTLENRVGVAVCRNQTCRRVYLLIVSTDGPIPQLTSGLPKFLNIKLPRHCHDGHDGVSSLKISLNWNFGEALPIRYNVSFLDI